MRRQIVIGAVLLLTARTAPAQTFDYADYVARVKAAVQAAGIDLNHGPGECGRAEVTHRVAWALRGKGWGLLVKTGAQNGCGPDRQPFFSSDAEPKFGVDVVLHGTTGECRDILAGGGDGNTPAWNPCSGTPTLPTSMYRPAYDPGPPYVPLTPGPGPVDPPVDPPSDLAARVAALEREVARLSQAQAATQQELANLKAATVDSQIPDLYNRVADHDRRILALESRPYFAHCSVQFGLRCELRP